MKRTRVLIALSGFLAFAGLVLLNEQDVPIEFVRAQQENGDTSRHRRAPPESPTRQTQAAFGELAASPDARKIADWVVRTGDHDALPFLIIDKRAASLHVFNASGRAETAAPVLLGVARGDRFEPGSAEKDMRDTSKSERITPAGRFLSQPGLDDKGHHVVWIQYEAGISIHAVLDTPGERRRKRLATPTPDDNRISFGCINLPSDVYRDVIRPLTERSRAVVYVLPDSQDALEFFASLKGSKDASVRTANR